MTLPSEQRLAQLAIGVLLLVIVRALGEFFRLQYLHGAVMVVGEVAPYVGGALFATVALALTIICYFASFYRASMAIAGASIVALFIYKVAVVGCC